MATKSNRTADSAKATTPATPAKFPLFQHRTGQWCKKVKGKHHYFGTDQDAALAEWLRVKDDLLAGREPAEPKDDDEPDYLTLEQLCNAFLQFKEDRKRIGKLTHRSWLDLQRTCQRICDLLGKQRRVVNLKPKDFADLHAEFCDGKSPVTVRGDVTRARMLFKFAFKFELIDKPLRYEDWLERPPKSELREARHNKRKANGKMFFTADEIQRILDVADAQLRAMIYLGINCGLNNSEVGKLIWSDLDLEHGWYDAIRAKSKVQRRAKLWQATISAIKVAQQTMAEPKRGCDDLVFLTHHGRCWHNDSPSNPLSKEFAKLLRAAGCYQAGRGFAALRHTFMTVAEETKDTIAVRLAMGHSDPTISELYREGDALESTDLRLVAIADHVEGWLNASGK